MFGCWKVRWQNVSSWQALLEEFLRILAQVQDDAQREKRFAEVLGQSTISSLVQRKRRGGHVAYSIFTTMTQLHFLTKAPEDEILHKISHPGSHYKKSDAAKWQFKKLKKQRFCLCLTQTPLLSSEREQTSFYSLLFHKTVPPVISPAALFDWIIWAKHKSAVNKSSNLALKPQGRHLQAGTSSRNELSKSKLKIDINIKIDYLELCYCVGVYFTKTLDV